MMRPIHYGIIFFAIGLIGWISFSVIIGFGNGISQGLGGNANHSLDGYLYLFGMMFFFSLPISIIGEIIRWRKNKKSKLASV